MIKTLKHHMRIGHVSDINFNQREVRLKKDIIKEIKHIKEEFKYEYKLIEKVKKLIKIFPDLKVRDANYLFTQKIGKNLDNVNLIIRPSNQMDSQTVDWIYTSPFIKVEGIKIHYYEYGICISQLNPLEHNYKYDKYGCEYYLRCEGWNDDIIKKTRSLFKLYLKHYESGWTFNYL